VLHISVEHITCLKIIFWKNEWKTYEYAPSYTFTSYLYSGPPCHPYYLYLSL